MIVVKPSDLKRFVYCPRLPLWDLLSPSKPPILQRLKMFKGKLYHFFKGLPMKGIKEELMEAELHGVRLLGKPDCYGVYEDKVILIELKSYRAPKLPYYFKGIELLCYPSDLAQLLCYAYILRWRYDKDVIMVLNYRDRAIPLKYDGAFESLLESLVDEYAFTVENLILHDTSFNLRCTKCQYFNLCLQVEEKCWG